MKLTPRQRMDNDFYNLGFIQGRRAEIADMRKSLLDAESKGVNNCFESPMYSPPHSGDE